MSAEHPPPRAEMVEQEGSERLLVHNSLAVATEQAALIFQAVAEGSPKGNGDLANSSKSPTIDVEGVSSPKAGDEFPPPPTTPVQKSNLRPSPPTSSNKNPRPNGKTNVKPGSQEGADSTKVQEELKVLEQKTDAHVPLADGSASQSKAAVEQKLDKVDALDEHKIEKIVRKILDKEDIFSRPTTASAFGSRTSSGQATRSPQAKAHWTSTEYWSLSAEPSTMFETSVELGHEDLESRLASRLISQQPDRRAIGIDEHLVRDVVNMTVKDIVGIFDSLLDRLLIEKKQGKLKDMVVELMTDDIANTIAAGQEKLKEQEISYVIEEMARLRESMRESEATWEQRFVVTEELGQAIENLRSDVDDRFLPLEARVADLEQDYVRWTDLDNHLLEITKEIKAGVEALEENTRQDEETSGFLRHLQKRCEERLATKEEMAQAQAKVEDDVRNAEDKMKALIESVRAASAREARVHDLEHSLEDKLKSISQQMWEANQAIEENATTIKKNTKFSNETYATKGFVQDCFSSVRAEAETKNEAIAAELDTLMEKKAEKTDVDDTNLFFRAQLKELDEVNLSTSNSLQEIVSSVTSLQVIIPDLATKDYSLEVARNYAQEVLTDNSQREEVAGLRREFAEERERARASVKHQQHNRKDLNSAIEELNDLRVKGSKMEQRCGSLEEKLTTLIDKEAEHWEKSQRTILGQERNHDNLSTLCNALREELAEHTERQRQESERLRDQTTLRYLEQLDKALHLNSGLDTLQKSHKQLHATVSNIHLPTIAGAANS